jgi:ribosomal protein S21
MGFANEAIFRDRIKYQKHFVTKVTGFASALFRCFKVVKIIVREDESPVEALQRFTEAVDRTYSKPWYKRRYGYYEKPSELRRKKRKMQKRNKNRTLETRIVCPIDLATQFRHTGSNATGR